jgi:hypothetical protein
MTKIVITPRVAAAFLTLALVGCSPKPPPSPIVSLDGRTCADSVDLGSAKAVQVTSDKSISVTLDDKSPCVHDALSGNRNVYAIFLLPQSDDSWFLSIDSIAVGERLFTPRAQLLDAAGNVQREITRDAFTFHGIALHAGLRPHPGEQYLLVTSDKASIGQSTSRIMDATQVTTGAGGGVFLQIHTGSESIPTFVGAYNGTIVVAAKPIPKSK